MSDEQEVPDFIHKFATDRHEDEFVACDKYGIKWEYDRPEDKWWNTEDKCEGDCDACGEECEWCGEIGEDNVVHSWGCVKLCPKCSINEDGTPHCPKDKDDECEHCHPESDEEEEEEQATQTEA